MESKEGSRVRARNDNSNIPENLRGKEGEVVIFNGAKGNVYVRRPGNRPTQVDSSVYHWVKFNGIEQPMQVHETWIEPIQESRGEQMAFLSPESYELTANCTQCDFAESKHIEVEKENLLVEKRTLAKEVNHRHSHGVTDHWNVTHKKL